MWPNGSSAPKPVVPVGGSSAPKPVVPVGGSSAPKQPPPQPALAPAAAAVPALPHAQRAASCAAPAPASDTSSTQAGKRKAGPDGASSPSKRVFQTAEGRRYEQDIFTGAVTWLDPPTAPFLMYLSGDGKTAKKPK